MTQVTQPSPSTVMGHYIMMIVMHFDQSMEHIILGCIGVTLYVTAVTCHHHF